MFTVVCATHRSGVSTSNNLFSLNSHKQDCMYVLTVMACFFVTVRKNTYTLSRKFLNTSSLQLYHSVFVNAADTFQLAATATLS